MFVLKFQMTLSSLIDDQKEAQASGELERLVSIKKLVESIHSNKDFVDGAALGALGRSLDDIAEGVAVLKHLTTVK